MHLTLTDPIFWISFGASCLALIAVAVSVFRSRRDAKKPAFACLIFRVALVLIFISVIGALKFKSPLSREQGEMHVLVDHSKSMEDKEKDIRKVAKTLSDWAQESKISARFHIIGDELTDLGGFQEIGKLPWPMESRIGSGIEALDRKVERGSPAVLLSDGVETGKGLVSGAGALINTISFGADLEDDIALVAIRFPPVAFARSEVPYKITVNFPKEFKTPLVLILKDTATGEVIGRSTFSVSGTGPQNVEMSLMLGSKAGSLHGEARIAPLPWESNKDNNRLRFKTSILREKLRILYLCGMPNNDYSYLREFLRANPRNELVSFVILRDPHDVPPYGESELSLIPFPAHEIFRTHLNEFDLFILQDFAFSRFGLPRDYLRRVKDFIAQGGGFVFLSGEKSANASEYKQGFFDDLWGLEPVAQALEQNKSSLIRGDSLVEYQGDLWKRRFALLLADEDSRKAWGMVNKLADAFQQFNVKDIRKNIDILAYIINKEDNIKSPAIVESQYGKGRATLLTFPGTWLWKAHTGIRGEHPYLYDSFWESVIKWVIKEEDVFKKDVLKVAIEKESLNSFKVVAYLNPMGSSARAGFKSKGKPMKEKIAFPSYLVAKLLPKGGQFILKEKTKGSGIYEASFSAQSTSGKKLDVRLPSQWAGVSADSARVIVELTRAIEGKELRATSDIDYLREIASLRHGQVLGTSSDYKEDILPVFEKVILEQLQRKNEEKSYIAKEASWFETILDSPWLLAVLAMLMFIEWSFRRWQGLT
ncbi:hypothetical protein ACFL6Y_09750 [Elusimicrobiota bacterium]